MESPDLLGRLHAAVLRESQGNLLKLMPLPSNRILPFSFRFKSFFIFNFFLEVPASLLLRSLISILRVLINLLCSRKTLINANYRSFFSNLVVASSTRITTRPTVSTLSDRCVKICQSSDSNSGRLNVISINIIKGELISRKELRENEIKHVSFKRRIENIRVITINIRKIDYLLAYLKFNQCRKTERQTSFTKAARRINLSTDTTELIFKSNDTLIVNYIYVCLPYFKHTSVDRTLTSTASEYRKTENAKLRKPADRGLNVSRKIRARVMQTKGGKFKTRVDNFQRQEAEDITSVKITFLLKTKDLGTQNILNRPYSPKRYKGIRAYESNHQRINRCMASPLYSKHLTPP